MSKRILVILFNVVLTISACGEATSTFTETPPTALPTATAILPSPVPQSSPHPLESSTAEPVATVEQTVPAPGGLRVVYLRDGDLWTWTETDKNVLLTDTGDISAIDLSKDGQLLSFMLGPDVWTVRMDGSDARLLVMQKQAGGALSFSPNGSLLAVSTSDHIDVIDLVNQTSVTVTTYPSIPNNDYPEIVWAADSSGFKTIVPPASEQERAEFLFVFPNGRVASLSKFSTVSPEKSPQLISPDGGYVLFVTKASDDKEALFLMDSSGAGKVYGEVGENIRLYDWLPDSKNFVYAQAGQERILLGNVTGKPPVELFEGVYQSMRWLDAEHFLAVQDGNLYLGDINGSQALIAESVSAFDFEK
jgi:Tol biopolymer transport system component